MMAALYENFFKGDPSLAGNSGFVGHWSIDRGEWLRRPQETWPYKRLFGGHPWEPRSDGIYMVRDGRDVLVSMYEVEAFHHQEKMRLDFKEWLRTPLDWHVCPSVRDRRFNYTPAEHWYRSVNKWLSTTGISYVVRYEELLSDFTGTMREIAAHFDLKRLRDIFKFPAPAGHYPRRGRAGEWVHYFDADDLDFFFSIVSPGFGALYGMEETPIGSGMYRVKPLNYEALGEYGTNSLEETAPEVVKGSPGSCSSATLQGGDGTSPDD
jgi:hypothetical protein